MLKGTGSVAAQYQNLIQTDWATAGVQPEGGWRFFRPLSCVQKWTRRRQTAPRVAARLFSGAAPKRNYSSWKDWGLISILYPVSRAARRAFWPLPTGPGPCGSPSCDFTSSGGMNPPCGKGLLRKPLGRAFRRGGGPELLLLERLGFDINFIPRQPGSKTGVLALLADGQG